MKINTDVIHTTTDIPEYMLIKDLKQAKLPDEHLQQLKNFIIKGWPITRNDNGQELRPYVTSGN